MTVLIVALTGCVEPMTQDMKTAQTGLVSTQELSESLLDSLWTSALDPDKAIAEMTSQARGAATFYEYGGPVQLSGSWQGTATVDGIGAYVEDRMSFHTSVELEDAVYMTDKGPQTITGRIEIAADVISNDVATAHTKEGYLYRAIVLGDLVEPEALHIDYSWSREGKAMTREATDIKGDAGLYMAEALWPAYRAEHGMLAGFGEPVVRD